ncbi:hypothetical protein EDC04DRAFT_2802282 [Pisolithus marmoratus]|nr:hypothetical protein EDC04DRAFT_2802282 [Pisolithus marmoratus]
MCFLKKWSLDVSLVIGTFMTLSSLEDDPVLSLLLLFPNKACTIPHTAHLTGTGWSPDYIPLTLRVFLCARCILDFADS